MHYMIEKLPGGDRRSIGRSEEMVADVLHDPSLFDLLLRSMLHPDPLLSMRASDAAEKVTRQKPELLPPYAELLLQEVSRVDRQEVRWHLAQMLPRLQLSAEQRRSAVQILFGYLNDDSRIVRTMSMQALADLAEENGDLLPRVIALLRKLVSADSPAVRSRARKLVQRLEPLASRPAPDSQP